MTAMRKLRFDFVHVRLHEVLLYSTTCNSDDKRNECADKYHLGLSPLVLIEYTVPFETFEFYRHDLKARVERNHEEDRRDRRTRFQSTDETLCTRGWARKQRLLMSQCPVVEAWHIRQDGRVWQANGECSSIVMQVFGRFIFTRSQHMYKLGTIDTRLLDAYVVLYGVDKFEADLPFQDTSGLLLAARNAKLDPIHLCPE